MPNSQEPLATPGSKQPSRPHPTAPELPPELARELEVGHVAVSADTSKEPREVHQDENLLLAIKSENTAVSVSKTLNEDTAALGADVVLDEEPQKFPAKRGFWRSIGHFFKVWACNPWSRWATILLILGGASVVTAMPKTRYLLLNEAGVRSSSSVIVIDNTTQLPLKNVKFTVGGHQALTDVHGIAKIAGLTLGPQDMTIERTAFAPIREHVTIGWGSNPLGEVRLHASGVQYIIQVHDYLTGKPLIDAQAENDAINAVADREGKITLTFNESELSNLNIKITANGYRSESLVLGLDPKIATKVVMVPSKKTIFISKQSGKYDLYAMDIDGKNKDLILAGTGTENNNLSLVASPGDSWAALVSTRDNMRDKGGYLLSAITLVNVQEKTSVTVEHAEQIKIIDWIGNRIIYQTTSSGANDPNGQRNRIISYDYTSSSRIQLASANQFNMVTSIRGQIYFAPATSESSTTTGLLRIKPDGSGRQPIFNKEVWTGLRSRYDTLALQTSEEWYAYHFDGESPLKESTPEVAISRNYADSPSGSQSLWIDTRDGKDVLLAYDPQSGKDTVVATGDGLAYPVRWLTDTVVVYRISNQLETADYVVSLQGGEVRKIVDVTNAYGFAQGY